MNNNVSITLSLDKRRIKTNGKFPLKICVCQKYPKKQKYFPTKYEFDEEEYAKIIYPSKEKREKATITKLREELTLVKKKAVDVADKIVPFDFDFFNKKLYVTESQESDVFYQYDLYIKKLIKEGRIKTANSNYECSKKALINFQIFKNNKAPHLLDFKSVNVQFLDDFERYFVEIQKGSISTVGSYLRPLRAIFNIALEHNIINNNYYPFGKGRYVIPSGSKVKKALYKEELDLLYNATPLTMEQEIAKDFWFFSYVCYGMNVKDICLLRFENIKKDTIQFIRAKTKKSKRTNIHPIVIPLIDDAYRVLKKYSITSNNKSDFVFGKISDGMTETEKSKKIDAFNKFISQHIKLLAKSVGLDSDISTIWARHSFATMVINSGSMELAQECLGHASKKTTEAYFSGFAPNTLKDISKSIMSFKK
ncbi:MAG: site-specific integrase [Flavobacterium sp.]|nr:site-specific integrase [Flavobacterium sp.]